MIRGWVVQAGSLSWQPLQRGPLASDWAECEPVLVGICGTDLQLLQGYAGFSGVPGHEFVARIVDCSQSQCLGQLVVGDINVGCGGCAGCLQGDARHCPDRRVLGIRALDGAMAERFRLPLANLYNAEGLPAESSVFAEPLAAALEVVDLIPPQQEVLLVGAGRLGALIALVLQGRNPLVLCARSSRRRQRLEGLGFQVLPPEALKSGWPYLVEASGSPSGLETALRVAAPGATVVVKSTWAGAQALELSPLVVNCLRLVGSRCGSIPRALQALRQGLDPRPLIERVFSMEELPEALQQPGFKSLLRGSGSGAESR
jgi:threonine dehydrogenase-like Zn-dependent dehydrogenase